MSFNLNEEVIDGHLVTSETKKLWAVEMDLAKKLLEVCKKHNLKIWATDGTLLGAVRHKGFIPWDDDMDFCMMRDDYNKLMEIGPKEFKEPYFFQSFYTDAHSWESLIKIRRSDTTMIEKDYQIHKDFNRGVFIDVLVLDAVPNDMNKIKILVRKVRRSSRMLQKYRMFNPSNSPFMVKVKHWLICLYVSLITPKRIRRKIERLVSSNKISDNEYCCFLEFFSIERRDISRIKLRDKHCFDETVYLPFHDMQLPAPKGYDTLLKAVYGDYMKPVKGVQSHGIVVVDTERSYIEVLSELRNNIIN